MLERSDIALLQDLFYASEERILQQVDEKILQSEERILRKVDEKLADLSLQFDEKLLQTETRILQKVDEKILQSEERILLEVDDKLAISDSLILNEIYKIQSSLDARMDKIQKNMDEVTEYYNIKRLEDDTTTLLLQKVNVLEHRVDNLEIRMA